MAGQSRWRTLRVAIVSGALIFPIMLTSAAPVSAATYTGPCVTTPTSVQTDHTIEARTFTTGAGMYGVTMDVHVRNLRPCTGATSTVYDYPAAVVTLQRASTGYPTDLVQLGYVECNKPGGMGAVACDGNPHWVYTRGDNESGETSLFDTHYHAPVVGHEYRLRISNYTTSGGNEVWQYCIRDKATEPNYTCHTGGHKTGPGTYAHARSWNVGRYAWWGFETQNKNSAQGTGFDPPSTNEPYLYQRWLQYLRGTDWWVAEPIACRFKTTGVRPSWFGCAVHSTVDVTGDGVVNDEETLQVVTIDRDP